LVRRLLHAHFPVSDSWVALMGRRQYPAAPGRRNSSLMEYLLHCMCVKCRL
jgi:hypothetical protein